MREFIFVNVSKGQYYVGEGVTWDIILALNLCFTTYLNFKGVSSLKTRILGRILVLVTALGISRH